MAPLKNPLLSAQEKLTELREAYAALTPPQAGWLQAAREARGVTQKSLATKLGFKRQAWAQLETSEARGAISLYSLRRAAGALGYELVYALVPQAASGSHGRTAAAEVVAAANLADKPNASSPPEWRADDVAEGELPTALR